MAKKPAKFPLHLHSTGQWRKKHRRKAYYFGTDKDEALKRYVREWPDILAGRVAKPESDSVTLGYLCDSFLTAKRARIDSGELSLPAWHEYRRAAAALGAVLQPTTLVGELRADDFARARDAVTGGPLSVRKFVVLVRSMFKWAYESELIDAVPRYGPDFKPPARRVVRVARAVRGKKLIDPADLRRLIDAANPPMRAMILLGINCGFGGTDCSNLTTTALSRLGWVELHREKTGAERRCPLWPETALALSSAMKVRPSPVDTVADADQVFLTRGGHRWDRYLERPDGRLTHLNCVSEEYRKLRQKCRVSHPGGFYTLRHTHRTIADGSKDQPACDLIMGHTSQHISGAYRERIDDSRLVAVTELIRNWLNGE